MSTSGYNEVGLAGTLTASGRKFTIIDRDYAAFRFLIRFKDNGEEIWLSAADLVDAAVPQAMRIRHPDISTQDIVEAIGKRHLTQREAGFEFGMSAAAIGKRLRHAGVPARIRTHVKRRCSWCRELIEVRRCKGSRVYCNRHCYFATRENPIYCKFRQGGHATKAVIIKHFQLEHHHVIRHRNLNPLGNAPANLVVFDPERPRVILWTGATCQCPRCNGAADAKTENSRSA
jgi:hypothetical protein